MNMDWSRTGHSLLIEGIDRGDGHLDGICTNMLRPFRAYIADTEPYTVKG